MISIFSSTTEYEYRYLFMIRYCNVNYFGVVCVSVFYYDDAKLLSANCLSSILTSNASSLLRMRVKNRKYADGIVLIQLTSVAGFFALLVFIVKAGGGGGRRVLGALKLGGESLILGVLGRGVVIGAEDLHCLLLLASLDDYGGLGRPAVVRLSRLLLLLLERTNHYLTFLHALTLLRSTTCPAYIL